ncbi:phosphotransferase family protein [Actinophytocola sp.]|uniref:phosphotransferase family protein n=1 Tax=Actinophytocola sp. TaxID=1872138 RepID=UPI003D6B0C88
MYELDAALDTAAARRWLARHGVEFGSAAAFELIEGGRSNLTYRFTDASGRQLVLRRPPLSGALPSAHDMDREVRLLTALAGSAVPVPRVLANCRDVEVIGAPFYVMEFVDGIVVRTRHDAERLLSTTARARVAGELAAVLAGLHAVDPGELGLADIGPGVGFVPRQLRRWLRQWELGSGHRDDLLDDSAVRSLHAELVRRVPAQERTSLIHGDYRLDNLVVGADGSVRAVLDWELSTLGDPFADVGLMLAYWTDHPDEVAAMESAPSSAPGFPSRSELRSLYIQASGDDVRDIAFYLAFAFWRNAVLLSNVYARYLGGAYGEIDQSVRTLPERAAGCLRLADSALDGSLLSDT